MRSVVADIDQLLAPKSYDDLETLETQIKRKLRSNEPIDADYWEQLLKSLFVWKAKAKLKKIYQSVTDARVEALKLHRVQEAAELGVELFGIAKHDATSSHGLQYCKKLDPDAMLQLSSEDKSLQNLEENTFLHSIVSTYLWPLIQFEAYLNRRRKDRSL